MSRAIGAIVIYSLMVLGCKTIWNTAMHPTYHEVSTITWAFLFGFFLAIMNDFDLKVKVPSWVEKKFKKKKK